MCYRKREGEFSLEKEYVTEQEKFWAGEFGDKYIDRNIGVDLLAQKIGFWSRILRRCGEFESCLELGCNIGLNLKALGILLPYLKMTGVEINMKAANACSKMGRVNVINSSIFEYRSDEMFDLTFTSVVLIHINPDMLSTVYDILYRHSKKYILVTEYYNPTPMEVNYRGNTGKLFKRDFAGELMDRYPTLKLVDYGFQYHRDNHFSLDDITWFLLEK